MRFNRTRHGEPNGVVRDTDGFIHREPDGMKRLGLEVGDAVVACGGAHARATGAGWAVEAVEVDGRSVQG